MNGQTVVLLATVGSTGIYVLVEAIKRTGKLQIELLPLVGAGVGIVVGFVLSLSVGENPAVGATLGLIAGLAATGVHENKKNVGKMMTPDTTGKDD